MRVLVTGGAGFIGRHVVRELVGQAATVAVLDDLSTGDASLLPDGVTLLEHDIADASVVEPIASWRPEVVVHCAAQTSVAASVADPERDAAVNVAGTRHVAAGAAGAGAYIVFLSSGGAIYGNTDGADETAAAAPESPYGQHKLAAEASITASGRGGILRLANVYGRGQRADAEGGVVAIFVDHLVRGESIVIHGTGAQVRDFVHVDDVVGAILRMAARAPNGTWNVGSGVATSIAELLGKLEALLGRRAIVRHAPQRPGDVSSSRLLIGKIRRELDWQPSIDLDRGLASLIAGS